MYYGYCYIGCELKIPVIDTPSHPPASRPFHPKQWGGGVTRQKRQRRQRWLPPKGRLHLKRWRQGPFDRMNESNWKESPIATSIDRKNGTGSTATASIESRPKSRFLRGSPTFRLRVDPKPPVLSDKLLDLLTVLRLQFPDGSYSLTTTPPFQVQRRIFL